jgi:chromosome segregation ATPase
LRTIESSEKRRNDVALETEKSLTEAKYEISQLRKEVQFLNTNRGDLELALGSLNEEKRMLERELLSIRAQLQLHNPPIRAPLHPLSNMTHSSS